MVYITLNIGMSRALQNTGSRAVSIVLGDQQLKAGLSGFVYSFGLRGNHHAVSDLRAAGERYTTFSFDLYTADHT